MKCKKFLAGLAAAAVVAGLAACSSASTGSGSSASVKVGMILPDDVTPRWESQDRPAFTADLKKDCPTCTLLYANSKGDQATQLSQAQSMISQGIKYLVFNPVDATAAVTLVNYAKQHKVTLITYGRLPTGDVDYNVTDPDLAGGMANGTGLKDALEASGRTGVLIWLNGDQTTPNTKGFRQGALDALGGKWKVGREYYIKGWDPAAAQTATDQAITALGKGNIAGVFAMNDGIAGGAIAAMKAAGISPLPPIGGMDTDVAAVQRILTGEQSYTVFRSPFKLAGLAAQLVGELVAGKTPTTDTTINNGTRNVPTMETPLPTIITKDNIQKVLIDGGFYKYSQICTSAYKTACDSAGLH